MTWTPRYRFDRFLTASRRDHVESFRANEQCYIRKGHRCGKIYAASKSCFIACPTDDELEPILELISEKLSKSGVEPIIAVKERAYGQDIFCTKICGKIIEARFCIVILDDTITEQASVPNPNVYYEYGLMTPLGKHIIPLQKADLKLALNIQSYDTVKYNSKNLAPELDRAIKDALRVTETQEKEEVTSLPSDKLILRRFEMSGFELMEDRGFLSEVIDDTLFRGFEHSEKGFYLYLGKIDSVDEFQTYIEDLGVVLYRSEKKGGELEQRVATAVARRDSLVGQKEGTAKGRLGFAEDRALQEAEKIITDSKSKQALMSTIYLGFITDPHLDASGFRREVEGMASQYKRYKTSYSVDGQITVADIEITLASTGD